MIELKEAKQHGTDLVQTNYKLHKMQAEMDDMINMDWKDKPTDPNLKFTTSPDARNQYMGALRLLTAVDPIIKVPYDVNDVTAKEYADKIEKICKAIWYHSGRILQKPVHYELVASMLRYGQFHMSISDTDDLLEVATKRDSKASKARKQRYEHFAKVTPYIFQPLDPKCGNAEFDAFGLTAYYREQEMTYGEIMSKFGVIEKYADKRSTDTITYKDYWNLDVHYAWIDDDSEPLIEGEHRLPCIPIVVQGGEGSLLNDDPEKQYQPLLYGVWKGDLWDRHNLELTAIYSNLFAVASNAMFVHKRSDPDSKIEVDFDNIGGIIHLNPGDDIQPLQRDVLNKDMLYGMEVVERMIEESTLYKQVFGQSPNTRMAYSAISLLSQSGQLPLIATQRSGGWGIGTGFEKMFTMMRDKKKKRTAVYESDVLDLDPKELKEDLIIDVKLDADLPQDKLQQANIAGMLKQYGLASDAWIRENVLNVGQSKDMTKEVIEENYINKMMEEHLTGAMRQEITQQVQQQLLQQMQQQQAQQQQMMQQQQMQQEQMMQQQQQPQEVDPRMQEQMMAEKYMRDQRFVDQNNPNRGGMPAIVGQGAIPAQRPNQMPTTPNPEAEMLQEGEM
jgi:GTPase SAR1 family protein